MKILHIIGNGFDLNLGIKTSYKDFYSHYNSIESNSSLVQLLKKNISRNYNTWSDLELALGQYTVEINELHEFDEIFENIGEELAKYLEEQESNFDFGNTNKNHLITDLVNPEMHLPERDKNLLKSFKQNFYNVHWGIDIVTFNYTRVIEKIIGDTTNLKVDGHVNSNKSIIFRGIKHIHGYTNEKMVLGVNDLSQLKNKKFHEDQDITEAIIKTDCNIAQRHLVDDFFKTKIKQAQLVCIFGASIGETDKIWWELIGNELKKRELFLIIFSKGEEVISPRAAYKNSRTERKIRNYFLNKTSLNETEKKSVNEKIFVSVDSNMFGNIKNF